MSGPSTTFLIDAKDLAAEVADLKRDLDRYEALFYEEGVTIPYKQARALHSLSMKTDQIVWKADHLHRTIDRVRQIPDAEVGTTATTARD